MVSTRQMAITTGPCASDDGFQPTNGTPNAHNRAAGSAGSSAAGTTTAHIVAITATPLNGAATVLMAAATTIVQVTTPTTVGLQDLPIELLDKMCAYVGYKKTAQMRMVS